MTGRRDLVVAVIAVAVLAALAGGGWGYQRLWSSMPLGFDGGEFGGTFYTKHHSHTYDIPDEAFGRYAGRSVSTMPVGSGPAYLDFTIYNSADYAVTIDGLAPQPRVRGTRIWPVSLLLPASYSDGQDSGLSGSDRVVPFRPETIPAHKYGWIGVRFATAPSCAGVSGSRRWTIGQIPLRIHYLRVFDRTQWVDPPWVAVATCGPFHPVLNP